MRLRLPTAAVLAVLLVLLVPSTAQAELNWSLLGSSQEFSSTGQDTNDIQVEADPAGNAVAIWLRSDGSNVRVQAAFRPAGGSFQAPAYISPAGQTASAPRLAMGRNGDAIAIWKAGTQTVGKVRVAGGAFSAATVAPQLLSGTSTSTIEADVGMGPDGEAIVAFAETSNLTNLQQLTTVRRSPGASGTINNRESLFTGNDATGRAGVPRVEIDQQGRTLVAFASAATTTNQDLQLRDLRAAIAPKDDFFGNAELVGSRGTDFSIILEDIAISNGNAMVGFSRNIGAGRSTVRTAYRPAGATTFQGNQSLDGSPTDPQQAAYSMDIDMFGDGEAVALYTKLIGGNPIVQVAFRKKSGIQANLWSGVTRVDNLGPADMARVAVDDSDRGVIQWTEHGNAVGQGPGPDKVWVRSITDNGTEGNLRQVGSGDIDETALAVSAGGQAVSVWTQLRPDNNKTARAAFGIPPGLGAPAPPLVPPPPPPPPEPLSIIQPAATFEPGKAIVITANVINPATRLDFDISGSGPRLTGTVVNGRLQNSIRLRPKARSFTVTVTVTGPGGRTKTSRSLTLPKSPPVDSNVRKVEGTISRSAPEVFAVGDPRVLLGDTQGCGPMTVYSGVQKLSGCFKPIERLSQVPSRELGFLQPMAKELGLDPTNGPLMQAAVARLDGYKAEGLTKLNDLWPVVPTGGADVLSFPQADLLTSSSASVEVAGQKFGASSKGFSMDLDPSRANIPLGDLPKPPKLPSIGGFELVGDWDVDLQKGEARIKASLKLPKFITTAGIQFQNEVTLRATPDRLILEAIKVGPVRADVGALKLTDFKLGYEQPTDLWLGQGRICLLTGVCVDMAPPNGGIKIQRQRLVFAGASVNFPLPGIPLFTGVNLERIGFGLGLDPTRITGNGRVAVAKLAKVDGRVVAAFPSSAAPFTLRADEVGGGFPGKLYGQQFTRPTFGATAGLEVDVPVIGTLKLGDGYFLYGYPAYVALGGGVDTKILDVISMGGSLSGEANFDDEVVNLHGDLRGCLEVVRKICKGAVANVSRGPNSAGGAGACIQLGPVSVGGGIKWNDPFDPYIWPFDGCKWSPFKLDVRVSAAQAAGAQTVVVKRGKPSPAIKLYGQGGAPRVRVTGPGGQALDSTDAGLDTSAGAKIRILRFEGTRNKFTVIGLQNARPGRYTIAPLPGSVPVTRVARATDQPNARISAKVTGKDTRRVLTYKVRKRARQTVQFREIDQSGAARRIGTIGNRARGSIRFSPAPGRGVRRVEAQFALNGMPAERRTVARFRAPAAVLKTPQGLTIKRRKGVISARWKRVQGAARYEVAVTGSTGFQRVIRTRKRAVAFKRVPLAARGRVTVRAVDTLRQSRVSGRAFKRVAAPRSVFQRLGRCRKVSKKKISCGKQTAKKKTKAKKRSKRK